MYLVFVFLGKIEFRCPKQTMEPANKKGSQGRTLLNLIALSDAKFGKYDLGEESISRFSFECEGVKFKNWSSYIGVTCEVCKIRRPTMKWSWTHRTPKIHLDKGCPLCSKEDKFKKRGNDTHPNKFDYSQVIYVGPNIPVTFKCMIHDELIIQTPDNHISTKHGGCKSCQMAVKSLGNKHTENFFSKLPDAHRTFYDYSKVDYQGTDVKVIIICPVAEHGEFRQTPANHLQGKGCPKCGIIKSHIASTKTNEEWLMEAEKVHGKTYEYPGKYVNYRAKITIRCGIHGDFLQSPADHLRGHGCHMCGLIARGCATAKTDDEWRSQAREVHGDDYEYPEKYTRSNIKITITCGNHGDFMQTPDNHLRGHGCHKCAVIERIAASIKTNDEWCTQAFEVHGEQYEYPEKYIRSDVKITIKCKTHGYFAQNPVNHLQGHGCPKCAQSGRGYTSARYQANCEARHGTGLFGYDKCGYTGGRENVTIYCNKCKQYFTRSANSHYKFGNCTLCSTKSYGERTICRLLHDNNIRFRIEYCLPERSWRYDFLLLDYGIMIEYDGIQHFSFVERFQETLEVFEYKKEVDVCKTLDAYRAGYALIRIDHKIRDSLAIATIINDAIKQKGLFNVLVTSNLYEEMMNNVAVAEPDCKILTTQMLHDMASTIPDVVIDDVHDDDEHEVDNNTTETHTIDDNINSILNELSYLDDQWLEDFLSAPADIPNISGDEVNDNDA